MSRPDTNTDTSATHDEQIKQIEIRVNEAVEGNIENILFEAINLKNPVLNYEQQKSEKKTNHNVSLTRNDDEKELSESISGKALGIAYQVYEGLGSAQINNLSMSTVSNAALRSISNSIVAELLSKPTSTSFTSFNNIVSVP